MIDGTSLATFIAAGLILNITPGPDMIYVAARSLGQGRAAGMVSAVGIFVGCLFHMIMGALGVAAVLASLPFAFDVLRWVGAAYLVWLGAQALLSKQATANLEVQPMSLRRIFLQGVTTNVLNPKVALFFLAFIPQCIDPAQGSVTLQFMLLGAIFDVNGTLILMGVAALAGRFSGALQGRWTQAVRYLMGVTFIGLGVRVAADR